MLGKCIECVNCVNCADIYQCEEIDVEIECPFFKNRKVEGDKMECNMCGKKFSGSHVKIEKDTYCIDCAMKLEKITKDMCSKCERRGESDPGNFKCDEIPRPVHAKGYKCKNCDTLTEGKIMCAICHTEYCENCVKDKCPKCAEKKEDELKIGDVVQLKSGSPSMTITCIRDNIVKCDYYVFFVKHTTEFHVDCLEKVEVE